MACEPLTQQEYAQIRKHVQQYAEPDDRQGLAATAWTVMYVALGILAYPAAASCLSGWQFAIAVALCAWLRGVVGLRCFVLFHDCLHESAFATKALNVWVGKAMGGYVLTDFNVYRMYHMNHHQLVGDEDATEKDVQGTIFWTTEQWKSWSWHQRAWLRVFRDPFVYYGLTAFLVTVGQGLHRGFFLHQLRPGYKLTRPARGVRATPWRFLALADLALGTLCWGTGYAMYGLAASWVSTVLGFIIFHWHHYVAGPTYYGVKKGEHNPVQAALEGSTLITFPAAVHAFLLNIAYHHIHHLNMRVPGYNLKRCHDDLDPRLWRTVPVVGWRRGLASLLLVQYNMDKGMLEPFPAYRWMYRLLA